MTFGSRNAKLPAPFDPARAQRTLAALAQNGLAPSGESRPLLEAAFGNSPYLARTALRDRDFLNDLVARDAAAMLDEAIQRKRV